MREALGGFLSNEYVLAAVSFAVLFIVIRSVFWIGIALYFKASGKASKEDAPPRLSGAATLLALFAALPAAAGLLSLEPGVLVAVRRVSYTAASLSAAVVVFNMVDVYLLGALKKMGAENDLGESLRPIIRSLIRIVIVVMAAVYVLGLWGVQVAPLLAGLGIAGLALALALQPLLGNLFNGLALVLDGTFKVGDVIKLASGEMGTVHSVGLRTTKIKTFDNEMFIIPNTRLADSILQNFFLPDKSVRGSVDFGVEYGTDPEYVKQITLEEVNKISFIDKSQDVRVLFTEMADSSLNFRTLFWVDDISKRWPAHQEAISRIYRRLYEEKIGIPFPQRTVWMREEGKAAPVSPLDEKFKAVKGKYFPQFGYEYEENPPDPEREEKKS